MKIGDQYWLSGPTRGRPVFATIVALQGIFVVMEGEYKGENKRFYEHVCRFQGSKPRWRQQLSLFENKTESKLSKKHLN